MRILISSPNKIENEASLINGTINSIYWDAFHLRKPDWSREDILNLYDQLSDEVKGMTVLHYQNELIELLDLKGVHIKPEELADFLTSQLSTSVSCHSFSEIEALDGQVDYCFLSPIYDSISKTGYLSKFNKEELIPFLKKKRKSKIIALGGVTENNYNELLDIGFDGAAFLGAVWKKYE